METYLTNPLEIFSSPVNSFDSYKTPSESLPNSPHKAPNSSDFKDNLSHCSDRTVPDDAHSDYDSYLEEQNFESSPPRRCTYTHWAEPWSKISNPKPMEQSSSSAEADETKASESGCSDWPSRTDVEVKPLVTDAGNKPYVSAWLAEYKPFLPGAGLANLGNTCFLNAVLQCFIHSVPLLQGLISCDHKMPCDCFREGFCALCSLRELIELSMLCRGGVISPWKFVTNLYYFSSDFQRYQQEDAHEFLQCFLDKLGSYYGSKKTDVESSDSVNFVKKVFGGRLVSKLQCCNCRHCSDTYEPSIDLSLEIEDADTLFTALESFTKIEKIEDLETKFTCDKCKEQVPIEKQLMLDQAPSIAAFHLKRFKTDGSFVEKIDKFVGFPLELDLLPYWAGGQVDDGELRYDLYAVVVHIGLSSSSGHYYCFVRYAPSAWYKFDDSKVTLVREEYVMSQEAYILFYAKQGTPWFSSFIDTQKLVIDQSILNASPKSVLDNAFVSSSSPWLPLNDQPDTNDSGNTALKSLVETTNGQGDDWIDDSEEKENLMTVPIPPCSNNSLDMLSCEAGEPQSEATLNNEEVVESAIAADVLPTLLTLSSCKAGESREDSKPKDINTNEKFDSIIDTDVLPATAMLSDSPEIYREDAPESTYSIAHGQLRIKDQVSCKRKLNKDLEGPPRKEACAYIQKSMSGLRAQQLMAAVRGPETCGSVNKKRGRRMHLSSNTKDQRSSARRRGSIPLLASLR